MKYPATGLCDQPPYPSFEKERHEYTSLIRRPPIHGPKLKARTFTRKLLSEISSFSDIAKLEHMGHRIDLSLSQANQLFYMAPSARCLCNLVGMTSAKAQLFDILMMKLASSREGGLSEQCNFIVLGPPGVGKTSLLRAFADMLSAGGLIRRQNVVFAGRSDLVGQYLGSTAIKTAEVVKKALGGFLVLDEVYSLGGSESRDFFAKEAIDTLTHLMDVHKHELFVAIAGYEKEVKTQFMSQNAGLDRRFMFTVTLTPYSQNELGEIFKRECERRGWSVHINALAAVVKKSADFKNHASDAVALASKLAAVTSKNRWLAPPGTYKHNIIAKDVIRAFEQFADRTKDERDCEHMSMYM